MARNFTLLQIRDRAKRRGDFVNSDFVSDTEWNEWASGSYAWLVGLLADAGIAPSESTQAIAANGAKNYALPGNYWRTLLVQHEYQTGYWRNLKWIQPMELHRYDHPGGSQADGYRIVGTELNLLPAPSSGQSYRHIYIPAPEDLTLDAQIVDGVAGWEELLVIDMALKGRVKERSDVADLMAERAIYLERIEKEKANREMTASHRAMGLFEDEQGRMDAADWRWWEGGS